MCEGKMKLGIYIITNTITGKVYVGSSVHLNKRKITHICTLRNGYHPNKHLQSAWDKYSERAFIFEIVEYCSNEADLLIREDWWMELLGSRNPEKGYNLRTAERGRHSSETRAKIGVAHKGKVVSEETRHRLSLAQKGKTMSVEARVKMSMVHKGKPQSSEHRDKIGAAHRGKIVSTETRAKMSESAKRRRERERQAKPE